MNSERKALLAGCVVVLAGSVLLAGVAPARKMVNSDSGWEGVRTAAGPVAPLVADVLWLRLNVAWERRDEPALRRLIARVLAAEPENLHFRLNAARMLAYDLPAWRLDQERGAPSAVIAAWRRRGAEEAVALLRGSDDPLRLVEAANIMLYAGHDRAAAADLYRRAAEQPRAPWHAGRIHAQLLRELGRDHEAVEWLREWLPRLPADDPAAQRDLVEARLAALELELRSRGEPL